MQSQLDHEHEVEPGVSTLVGGIIQDAQKLVRQQLTLFQVEFKNDAHRTIAASIPLLAGMVVSLVAAIILAIMVAHLLPWIWPQLPLWGGFAIVGVPLAIAGGALVLAGKSKFESFNPLPEQSLEGLKENIQWQTKP